MQCQPLQVGMFACLVVSTKLLASSTMRANALFVFVIASFCVPKCSYYFLICLRICQEQSNAILLLSFSIKKKDHFKSEHSLHVQMQQ
jgi:hypothetical protein